MNTPSPHSTAGLLRAGPPPEEAAGVLILIHGRGASARTILYLYDELSLDRLSALAPQAAGQTWYPHSFLAPIETNQPYLDSAITLLESMVADLIENSVKSEKIAVLGFSQGACLTLEFAARHPRRYGAIIGLTGGLIGPHGTPRNYPGSLAGTNVLLASSDPDPHVPFERVRETQQVLEKMGASVDLRRYPGMPHTINDQELQLVRNLLAEMIR